MGLAAAVLGADGYEDFVGVLAADDYLATQGGGGGGPGGPGGGLAYSSDNYYVAIYGTPSENSDWALQLGGHHMAYNITYLRYDVLVHRVVSHKIFVMLRSDPARGLLHGPPQTLETLRYQHTELVFDRTDASVWRAASALFRGRGGISRPAWRPEALGWEGAKRANTPSIQPMSNAARRDASGLQALSYFSPAPYAGHGAHRRGQRAPALRAAAALPAPFIARRGRWRQTRSLAATSWQILGVVTAFTLGHSLTLVAGALGGLALPNQPVEVIIAASIPASSVHAAVPVCPRREAWVAAGFGLLHGVAFSEVLAELGLGGSDPRALPLERPGLLDAHRGSSTGS
ncbi:HupE/UreJ family protein [Haliangium ochraceum]|uniref:Uncharacterized protein n=1 Tax=Haliangium ochraceum (strain DSM 14365 / JCM 11303 / SMP-2) TaxID=502025 RepID=D0LNT6_HALO1|nr:HupE/UreJ family protein [Haliangium ochraceum]ACY18762.1 hypothetical protein Hoch_6291 [Haliangium ochraceum DSM 14365]